MKSWLQQNNQAPWCIIPVCWTGIFFAVWLLCTPLAVVAQESLSPPEAPQATSVASDTVDVSLLRKNATLLALLSGPLGGHRIYLGTVARVPVLYALTLGGVLGLIPLIDIAVLWLSPNPSQYLNNPRFIMWLGARKESK
ncbi:MAG TPA: NINE protein [Luteibaculaceae bacterium]|nr:NINE protein [Luteibaculaceae bacterium]